MTDAEDERHYREPGWLTRDVLNRVVRQLTRWGISIRGARELQVRGRRSGAIRSVPLNVLTVEGHDYLVAPRGQTQWVRNLRAAGEGRLRVGRHVQAFRSTELPDGDGKVDVIRAYLRRWKHEVGMFFPGVDPDSPGDQLRAIAPRCPVFAITYDGDVSPRRSS